MLRQIFFIILLSTSSCSEKGDSNILLNKREPIRLNDSTEIELKELDNKTIQTNYYYNSKHQLKLKTEYVTFRKNIFQATTLQNGRYKNLFLKDYEVRFLDRSCDYSENIKQEIPKGNYTVYTNGNRNLNAFVIEYITKGNGYYEYRALLIDSSKKDSIEVIYFVDRQLPKSMKWIPEQETYSSLNDYYIMKNQYSEFTKRFN